VSDSPLVIHVQRPYATVEEYLEAEAWTIEMRSMLLIDAAELPLDTAVLFDVSIKGEKLIRAEGRVAAFVTPEGGGPGGLRVKFRRYGASTKAFIDRAVTFQRERAERSQPTEPEPSVPSVPELVTPSIVTSAPVAAPPPSAPESRRSDAPAKILSRPPAASERPAQPAASVPPPQARLSTPAASPSASQAPPASEKQERSGIREPSGVHRRPLAAADVPENRDALLARLRDRARNLERERFDDPERGTG
jgi:hypothetical protein